MKRPRTFKQLQQDPRVSSWSDERSGIFNDGLWIYLSPGWVSDEGMMTIVVDTVAAGCVEVDWARYSPQEWTRAMDPMNECLHSLLPAG